MYYCEVLSVFNLVSNYLQIVLLHHVIHGYHIKVKQCGFSKLSNVSVIHINTNKAKLSELIVS